MYRQKLFTRRNNSFSFYLTVYLKLCDLTVINWSSERPEGLNGAYTALVQTLNSCPKSR